MTFLRIVDNNNTIMSDPFIRLYIEDLMRSVRTQVILQLIKPYRSVTLDFMVNQLGSGISSNEVEDLLVRLILDEKIDGLIDQQQGRLLLNHCGAQFEDEPTRKRYDALERWDTNLNRFVESVMRKN